MKESKSEEISRLSPLLQQAWPKLLKDEGCVRTPYRDSLGFWTVGVGHNLAGPLTLEAVYHIFADDLEAAERECMQIKGWYEFPEHVQLALLNMTFNMGAKRVQEFKVMWEELWAGRYDAAANAALKSRWAKQVKQYRAYRVTELMRGKDVY